MSTASLLRPITSVIFLVVLALVLPGCGDDGESKATPNILFVVMDDIGIDQMESFGYGGDNPPSMPAIDTLARGGIRFSNTWAMPACTTTRGTIFDGRYPFRTNVLGALGPDDLANSQTSPYELTVPKLLAQKGYESALFGKFHIGLQNHNPAGLTMPHDLGWNYFAGWLDATGDPASIDTTAGGVAPKGKWTCGFVPGAALGGADSGACYKADGTCSVLASSGPIPPGRTCRDNGGIFDPAQQCLVPRPAYLNFNTLSGHYVGPFIINHEDGSFDEVLPTDPRARRFRAAADVDNAVNWIKQRPADKPWMATVSFASAHTPLMQPPATELPGAVSSPLDCITPSALAVLMTQMTESLDGQVDRLLVETGLATRGSDGRLVYRPEQTNTIVIVIGDNGTLGTVVYPPFSMARAKGTTYQTGVWVPLIISGPLVKNPDRAVPHMVNAADLFELFGEIAGIDVHKAVPRTIDSQSMLPYLTNPDQPSIRRSNFTQIGVNLQVNHALNGPCVIGTSCTQIPVTKGVCEDNGGIWWGPMADAPGTAGPEGLPECCNVNAFRAAQGLSLYTGNPLTALAIRNQRYKIVQNFSRVYGSPEQPCVDDNLTELFEIDEAVPTPLLDDPGKELDLDALTEEQQRNYDELSAELSALLASATECPGDGTLDAIVDQDDLDGWRFYSQTYGGSSFFDFNLDGLTDARDEAIIRSRLGSKCGTP